MSLIVSNHIISPDNGLIRFMPVSVRRFAFTEVNNASANWVGNYSVSHANPCLVGYRVNWVNIMALIGVLSCLFWFGYLLADVIVSLHVGTCLTQIWNIFMGGLFRNYHMLWLKILP